MNTRRRIVPIVLVAAVSSCISAPSDPWFNPPGGTWVPDSAVTSNMKDALDAALRVALVKKAQTTRPPTQYWFRYFGNGTDANRTIDIVGYPFPVSQYATDETFLGAVIPEACYVHARYLPSERKIEDLVISGSNCPPHI